MAENTETSNAPAEPAQAKLGMVQILLIIALVVVTQVVMKVVLDTFFPPPTAAELAAQEAAALAAEEEPDVAELGPANYLPLDPALVVNIQNKGKSQFLQTTIQLMTRNAEVYEAAKLHAPAIRSALLMLFSTTDFDSLSTTEGKERLQDDARAKVDEVLQDLAGVQGVDKIYLTSIVFQ